jgi:hypothetical protein
MSKLKIAGATFALVLATAATGFAQDADDAKMQTPSTEGIVTNAASCEYEGGSIMDLTDGKICFIAVRGVAANTQNYDGMRLGVMRCSGNGVFANESAGEYCRVYLTEKAKKKTRAELEAELAAMTEAELEATN